ncbi:asparagine synthase [Bacillus cereus]|uniref:asparagine synthase-related protein n=2 Tax=Bacillus cereus TaxID=1396 RepID=UPI000BEDFFCB|nr:asparagine synthase-related protein [Bacillus cereus]PED85254.1 asparagine synthase [Bacillus cereus]PES12935.1 asparagine synthase [Bacillus cereus]PEW55136.1 asparagine synthase [Bacillus cereus]PGO90285.1 asparagine synthase [Bacillus cereus]PGY80744.1 asparagine synthase [Bacillus cereus]
MYINSSMYGFINLLDDQQDNIHNSDFELWGSNGIIKYKGENTVASNNKYLVMVRGIDTAASSLLENITIKGIEEIQKVQGSVVLIDKEKEEILLYRDPTGRLPLYWNIEKGILKWSAQLKDLISEKSRLNREYFRQYFIGSGLVDLWEETPYVNISRVPRGQTIIFRDACRIKEQKNNNFQPIQGLHNINDKEIHQEYINLLNTTIRKHKETSALFEMSGGLDSTGLVIANSYSKHKDDQATTLTFQKYSDCNEHFSAELTASKCNLPWNPINADSLMPLSHILDMNLEHNPDEPSPDLCFYPWRLAILDKAKELGINTIISGYGGDELLEGNRCYIADYLKKGKILLSWKHSMNIARQNSIFGLSAWYYFKSYGIYPALGKQQHPSVFSAWDPSIHDRFLLSDYMENVEVVGHLKEKMYKKINSIKLQTEYSTQLARELSTVFLPYGVVDAIGKDYSIEFSFPYLDKRLIEFILGLPHRHCIDMQGRKLLTQRAFYEYFQQGFKRQQGNYYRLTFKALQQYWGDIYKLIINSPLCELGVISKEKTITFLEKWKCGKEVNSTRSLWALLAACLWVKNVTSLGGIKV